VGAFHGGQFRIECLLALEDNVEAYALTDLDGHHFEAQAFPMKICDDPSAKLFPARKRKIKRLFRSKNFVCEIEQAGKRGS
jgi:hypothetical protein